MKPGGRMLFSDALIVGGMISHEEIATRSSIGFYVYSPPGENERLLERAGFELIHVTDTTENASRIARQWHQAREQRKTELVTVEGDRNFDGLQRFLSCAEGLPRAIHEGHRRYERGFSARRTDENRKIARANR